MMIPMTVMTIAVTLTTIALITITITTHRDITNDTHPDEPRDRILDVSLAATLIIPIIIAILSITIIALI